MEDKITFSSFYDNRTYTFEFPFEKVANYKYFILFHDTKGGIGFRVYCFNDSNISVSYDSSYTYFTSSSPITIYQCHSGGFTESFREDTVRYNPNYKIAYCSDNLMQYKDTLRSMDFSLNLIEEKESDGDIGLASFTLRPIIEEQKDDYSNVFSEMFGILPVLLFFLIGFIGIRKAIGFLFSTLRRS